MKPVASHRPSAHDVEPPTPLLGGGGSAFERELVAAAASDAIPAASLERLARALDVPPSFVPAPALPRGTSAVAAHGVLAGLGAAGLIAALSLWGSPAPSGPATSQVSTSRPPALLEPATPRPAASAGIAPAARAGFAAAEIGRSPPLAPASAGSDAAAGPRPSRAATAPGNRGARTAPAAARRTSSADAELADGAASAELRALEAVQLALRAGQGARAERLLAEYERRFPRGELALEAELLAIDVSLGAGQRERARGQARALLAREDAALYRERLEALSREDAPGSAGAGAPSGSEHASGSHEWSGGF